MTSDDLGSSSGNDACVGEATIVATAAEIRRFAAGSMLAFADTVGRIVLERFYGGNESLWHSHQAKDVSLRRLAELLADAHLSASGLSRCISIHCVLLPLGPLRQWRHLTPSHVRAVLPLPSGDQTRLLREADAGAWSVRRLQKQIDATGTGKPRSRRRVPAFVSAVRRLDRLVDDNSALFGDLEMALTVDPETLEETYRVILRARERLERLQLELSPKRLGLSDARRVAVLRRR